MNDISNAIISRSKQNYFCHKVIRGVRLAEKVLATKNLFFGNFGKHLQAPTLLKCLRFLTGKGREWIKSIQSGSRSALISRMTILNFKSMESLSRIVFSPPVKLSITCYLAPNIKPCMIAFSLKSVSWKLCIK